MDYPFRLPCDEPPPRIRKSPSIFFGTVTSFEEPIGSLVSLPAQVSNISTAERTSPFSTLPDDILREILVACIKGPDIPIISPSKPPMIFHRISRSIRNIALTTPSLWASAHIYLFYDSDETTEDGRRPHLIDSTLSGVKRIFRLSGSLPMRITFDARTPVVPFSGIRIPSAVHRTVLIPDPSLLDHQSYDDLVTFSTRWEELNLRHGLGPSLCNRIAMLTANEVPRLQAFSYIGLDSKKEHTFRNSSLLLKAPMLTSISIYDDSFSLFKESINWAQLRDVKINAPLISQHQEGLVIALVRGLRSAAHLVNFDLKIEYMDGPWTGPLAAIPSLKTLRLTCSGRILANIGAPQLQALSLLQMEYRSDFTSLSDFVQSCPSLTELTVGTPRKNLPLITEPLKYCQSLLKLTITKMANRPYHRCVLIHPLYTFPLAPETSHRPFFEELISEDLCPNLIEFYCQHKVDISLETFSKCVKRFGVGSITAGAAER